jgi:DNA-directed RNA polymerase subunit omega
MLNELKIDELLGKVDSRYGLVVASAKRARQINEYTATLGLNDSLGIPGPQVHTRSQHSLSISIEELRQDKLEVGFREPPEKLDEGKVGAAAADDFLGATNTGGLAAATSSEVLHEGADEGIPADEVDPEAVTVDDDPDAFVVDEPEAAIVGDDDPEGGAA